MLFIGIPTFQKEKLCLNLIYFDREKKRRFLPDSNNEFLGNRNYQLIVGWVKPNVNDNELSLP